MKTSSRKRGATLNPIASALAFVIACLLQPALVQAQWTTPDANQNINNTNTGNVGIGTTTPTALLEVKKSQSAGTTVIIDNPFTTAGNSAYSGLFLKQAGANRLLISSINDNYSSLTPGTAQFWNFANGPTVFATNNTERMRITAGGNLGIGTTSPFYKLHVVSGTDTGTTLLNLDTGVHGGTAMSVFGTSNNESGFDMSVYRGGIYTSRFGVNSFGNVYLQPNGGDVAIGTGANPSARLDVLGPGTWVAKFRRTENSNGGILIDSPTGFNSNVSLATNGAVKWYLVGNVSNGDALQFWDSAGTTARFTFTQAGSLGIGTTNPTYKLHVQGGSVNATDGLCINGDCKSAWSQIASQWANGTGNINYTSGSVGIGTSSPIYSLDVNGGVNAFRSRAATVSATDTIATFENSSAIKMIVRGNGNVGIGTTSPTKPLDVVGDINASGTITGGNIVAKYQDVAEWVESSQELAAGTVVILDPSKSNQVVAATEAYDSRVAGVISVKPGITLGEAGEGRVLVASTGRVKVKVDAGNGPINIGDLLVTSDKEGVAMKSVPIEIGGVRIHRPGTLIGKALEPLAHGTGEILVLLSLQ